MRLLTADDVLNVKFEVSSFKEGYNQDEVDVFLDDVTTTMREFEERLGTSRESSGPSHRLTEILLTSEGVRNIRFSTTRWSGYHIDQVDAFLSQVLTTMEALEAQARTNAFAGQPGTSAGVGGAYGGEAYGAAPALAGRSPMRRDHSSESRSHRHPITIENFPSIGSYVAIASLTGRPRQSLDIFDIENTTPQLPKMQLCIICFTSLSKLRFQLPPRVRMMIATSVNYQAF